MVHVHFTLSPEHIAPFQTLLARRQPELEDKYSVKFEVTQYIQKSETDTIAVDIHNQPMRNVQTAPSILRPGGHGALIQKPQRTECRCHLYYTLITWHRPPKGDTIIYKKAIGGYLLHLRDKVYHYMAQLPSDDKKPTPTLLEEVENFFGYRILYYSP